MKPSKSLGEPDTKTGLNIKELVDQAINQSIDLTRTIGQINQYAADLEPILSSKHMLELLPITYQQLLTGVKQGFYPKPIKIGRRKLGWRKSEVAEFLANGCSNGDEA